VTDSATFTTPEADDEGTGEDLGDLLLEVLVLLSQVASEIKICDCKE
jgi:hypothetical protein